MQMLSRRRWSRSVGALSIAVLAGATFAGCGDGGDSDTSTDEGTEESAAADSGESTDGPPAEAPPEAVEFCEALNDFDQNVSNALVEEESPSEAEYFSVMSENFDTLAGTEAPDEIAEAWGTWTDSVSTAYDQLEASMAEVDPDDPDSGLNPEDFVAPNEDEEVANAEDEVERYREENCPQPELSGGAAAEEGEAGDGADDAAESAESAEEAESADGGQ